jgi:hypothetical protein
MNLAEALVRIWHVEKPLVAFGENGIGKSIDMSGMVLGTCG